MTAGALGFSPEGVLAVAGADRAGETIELVVVEDAAAFAASVMAGRDALFAERSSEWIPEATFVLRLKLHGAVGPPIPPAATFVVSGSAVQAAGRPPPGVAGPLLQGEYDPEAGGPTIELECLSGVPGRVRATFRGVMRRAFIPGENMIETIGETRLPTEIALDAPLVLRDALRPPAAPGPIGLELVARVPVPDGVFGRDVWGGEDVAYLGVASTGAVASSGVGLYVVDLGDPARPVPTPVLGVGPALDVVARGRSVYVASAGLEHGLYEIDASDPRAPRVLGFVDGPHIQPSLHNLFPDGDLLYGSCMSSCEERGLVVLDVRSGPPREIAYLSSAQVGGGESGQVHDAVVMDGVAWVANWSAGWQVVDVTDPLVPRITASFNHPGAQAHSIFPLGSGYLATADEYAGGHVRIWTLDGARGASEIAAYQPRRAVSAHNLWVDGTILYVAYYQDGVKAIDVSDPARPREVGAFATYRPRPSSPRSGYEAIFAGAWGVWASGERILVSDTEAGLYVLRRTF